MKKRRKKKDGELMHHIQKKMTEKTYKDKKKYERKKKHQKKPDKFD